MCRHEYIPFYAQPRLRENKLNVECVKCDKRKFVNAKRFLGNAAKHGKVYIWKRCDENK